MVDLYTELIVLKSDLEDELREYILSQIYFNVVFLSNFRCNKYVKNLISFINISYYNILNEVKFELDIYDYLLEKYDRFNNISEEYVTSILEVIDYFDNILENRVCYFVVFEQLLKDFLKNNFLTHNNYLDLVYRGKINNENVEYIKNLVL